MAELINLNKVRKRRDKQDASKLAEINRQKFGRTKAERELTSTESQRSTTMLDQHRLPDGDAT